MADPQHHVARVVAPLGLAPLVDLFSKIGGRLSGERRVGRTTALSLLAVTGGAGRQAACRVATVIEALRRDLHRAAGFDREGRVEGRHVASLAGIESPGDPSHLRMITASVGISVELPLEIAAIQTRQPRGACPVAATVEPVAGEAGIGGAGASAARRNDSPVGREAVERGRLAVAAAGKQARDGQKRKIAHGDATAKSAARFPHDFTVSLLLLAAACQPPPEQRHSMPMADAANGRAVIERVGCASCHTIAGIDWPRGKVGPTLDGLTGRGLIAGRLPNRPDVLAAFIRNAPALAPGSGMPAMPVTRLEARDIAAFLYQQDAK